MSQQLNAITKAKVVAYRIGSGVCHVQFGGDIYEARVNEDVDEDGPKYQEKLSALASELTPGTWVSLREIHQDHAWEVIGVTEAEEGYNIRNFIVPPELERVRTALWNVLVNMGITGTDIGEVLDDDDIQELGIENVILKRDTLESIRASGILEKE